MYGWARRRSTSRASLSTLRWRTTTRRRSRRRRGRSGSVAWGSTRARASSTSTSGRLGAGASAFRSASRLCGGNAAGARGAGRECTLKGGGVAGAATIGAAGVEVVQEVLAETQGAILPLVPYLDTLRWVFIAIAIAGIALAIYARWTIGRRAGDDRRPHCAARCLAPPCVAASLSPPCSCSCCRSGAPASGSVGWWNALIPWRQPMMCSVRGWTPRLAVLTLATSLLELTLQLVQLLPAWRPTAACRNNTRRLSIDCWECR